MTPTERGRMCQSCQKNIYDFRNWKTQEIHKLIREEKEKGQKVCGVFNEDQIQRYHTVYARRKGELHPQLKFVAALALVFGMTLFSCRSEVDVEDDNIKIEQTDEEGEARVDSEPKGIAHTTQIEDGPNAKGIKEEVHFYRMSMNDSLREMNVPRVCNLDPPFGPGQLGGDVIELGGIPAYDPVEEVLMGDINPMFEEPGGMVLDPEFSGGEADLFRYLKRHTNYPEKAIEQGAEGRVYVQFVVDKHGNIKDAEVIKGANYWLDQEALRVVENMPKWNPGKQAGRAVDVSYTLPISFVLK